MPVFVQRHVSELQFFLGCRHPLSDTEADPHGSEFWEDDFLCSDAVFRQVSSLCEVVQAVRAVPQVTSPRKCAQLPRVSTLHEEPVRSKEVLWGFWRVEARVRQRADGEGHVEDCA